MNFHDTQTMSFPIVTTIAEVRSAVAAARAQGVSVGFVPTMGALHEGHASLIRAARRDTGYVVVSIFVNPTQFGPREDFAKYPRSLDADREICRAAGADLVFAPNASDMYPEFSVTFVDVAELGEWLDGPARPGHFRGVCTVVLKLFNIVLPNLAYFGQKDAQQARIVRQMVRDLNVPVEVRVEATIREADGLAMSSRNRYLDATERAVAPEIYRALLATRDRLIAGQREAGTLVASLTKDLLAIPGARVDYAAIVDAETFRPLDTVDRPAVLAVAVYLGSTRLIDNIPLP